VYESRDTPPLHPRHFYRRVAAHFGAASALIAGSLLLGMWGYAHFEGLGAGDAFLNAAMILGGMGPVAVIQTPAGKLFAGCYALYSGLVFLVAVGIILAPMVHRALHTFHWDADQADR
jgi:hypothetical protein